MRKGRSQGMPLRKRSFNQPTFSPMNSQHPQIIDLFLIIVCEIIRVMRKMSVR